jgi:replicative DNA helicase
LSNSEDDRARHEAKRLADNIQYFCGFDREVFVAYTEYYRKQGKFPEFFHFVNSDNLLRQTFDKNSFVPESLPQFANTFSKYIRDSETAYIMSMLPAATNLEEKVKLTKRLDLLLQGEVNQDVTSLMSATNINIVEHTTKRVQEGHLKFPVNRLNEFCNTVGPGITVTIMGGPASGKSSLALNIAFLNSIVDDKRTLYLYLEDMPERYQYCIFSRYSYHIGDKIESNSLKRGINETDHEAIEKIQAVQERFQKDKKGEIYYIGMGQLSAEPDIFARKMAQLITELKIDIIICDYIQKVKTFKPQKWRDVMEYQNQIAATLTLLALGQYGNPPCINIMLSQLNREGQKKSTKTKGKMSVYDGAEISTIERDSQVVIGVYSDQELRDSGDVCVQILKNRDSIADVTTDLTHFDPAYCMLGDVRGTNDTVDEHEAAAQWDKEFGGL